jgi:hypothetical protein
MFDVRPLYILAKGNSNHFIRWITKFLDKPEFQESYERNAYTFLVDYRVYILAANELIKDDNKFFLALETLETSDINIKTLLKCSFNRLFLVTWALQSLLTKNFVFLEDDKIILKMHLEGLAHTEDGVLHFSDEVKDKFLVTLLPSGKVGFFIDKEIFEKYMKIFSASEKPAVKSGLSFRKDPIDY